MVELTLPGPCQTAVIGTSGGIGGALASLLDESGFIVRRFARSGPDTQAIDIEDEASIEAAARSLGSEPPLRLLIVATGLLHKGAQQPEKKLAALSFEPLARSFAVNTIGPALIAKHFVPFMPRDGRSIFAVLSAKVGSIGDNHLGGWYGYRASKAALNQIVRTLAIELKRTHPDLIVVALHPGTVATSLSAPFRGNTDPEKVFTPARAAERLVGVLAGLEPQASGSFLAYDGSQLPW